MHDQFCIKFPNHHFCICVMEIMWGTPFILEPNQTPTCIMSSHSTNLEPKSWLTINLDLGWECQSLPSEAKKKRREISNQRESKKRKERKFPIKEWEKAKRKERKFPIKEWEKKKKIKPSAKWDIISRYYEFEHILKRNKKTWISSQINWPTPISQEEEKKGQKMKEFHNTTNSRMLTPKTA